MAFHNNTFMIVSDERRNLSSQAMQSPQQSGAAEIQERLKDDGSNRNPEAKEPDHDAEKP